MSLAEIEAEIQNLDTEELRSLALKSWKAFLEKERHNPEANECNEDDPALLAALDEATARADKAPGHSASASEVRERLKRWISK